MKNGPPLNENQNPQVKYLGLYLVTGHTQNKTNIYQK